MNKKFLIGLVLVVLSGFIMLGCDNGTTGDSKKGLRLTSFITLNEENSEAGKWIPKNSFGVNEIFEVAVKGSAPEGTVIKLILSAKRSGSVIAELENLNVSGEFTQFWGAFNLPAGNDTLEIYAVDAQGNQSNTLSTPITVK
ncbi:MAG: hypothetical protein LBB78_04820 [Spirochaetaceae bacterium]|jgi:hypothetical protein|nr:hypothetical protein [Spirochaetaceae bacterium]